MLQNGFEMVSSGYVKEWGGVLYTCTVGEGTRRPSTMTVTELLLAADNAAAVSTTRDNIKRAAHFLDEIT